MSLTNLIEFKKEVIMYDDINFERDMEIDETALDVEWLNQPKLAYKYAQYVKEYQEHYQKLEEDKKIKRSELILEANENPKAILGKDKPNANDIEAYYRTQESYQSIVEELNEAKTEMEFAERTYQQIAWTRKKALENLVVLHGQQYFAGPAVPHDITEEKEKRRKDANKNVKMKRGNKKE